ncbi:uncharacterized protein GGS22DRAFT_196770 [Annulohypoxylon maeteangense]|uniref:uncharacterized protein n=1 Tax=Annulohypoxylon maeteangense TaxID=1927788 RepID=UPI0020084631|nr:uncharacterized protein GGS22DRAFT_196770 [Annulohypoxylon maeteangense]KAI0889095.1 hypothetical protein GGS22DRAFT_196770 [Annulohypoxylon maeteangense]
MFSGPNLFLREEIIAAGSKDACIFPYNFDGTGTGTSMPDTTKTRPVENCGWRGDSPEPQLDDITHDEELHLRIPDDTCSWHGDPAEPELDDLAHHSENEQNPKLSPKSHTPLRTDPQLLAVKSEPLKTPPKEKTADAPPSNKPPPRKDKEDDPNDESLQERVTHGVQQAFNIFRGMIESKPSEPEPSEGGKSSVKEGIAEEPRPVPPIPQTPAQPTKGKKSKEDREKEKQEKAEAKKAERERKAKEREEKKKLKKEKEAAKKEQRRKSKDKKKNKATTPPPELPAGAEGIAAAEADQQPGCHICKHPEEEGTIDFLRDSLENWQGLPSLDELTDAAKKLLNMTDANEFVDEQQADLSTCWDEQELVDHIVAHIDRHIHQYFDLDSPEGGNTELGKAPPLKPNPTSAQKAGPATPGKQLENGSPANHGLDGNRDWPLTVMQNHILRSLEPMPTPDIVATQSPQAYSPLRGPVSRCVSPWCEQLGFTIEDPPPSFPKRNGSWLRRGFNSSPSRTRGIATAPCLHIPVCSHGFHHEPAAYACVPVSLVPALCLEAPCCGHSACHYASPIMTPLSVPLTPHHSFPLDSSRYTEIAPCGSPRRSFSANEIRAMY